jgi:hypothetical protein
MPWSVLHASTEPKVSASNLHAFFVSLRLPSPPDAHGVVPRCRKPSGTICRVWKGRERALCAMNRPESAARWTKWRRGRIVSASRRALFLFRDQLPPAARAFFVEVCSCSIAHVLDVCAARDCVQPSQRAEFSKNNNGGQFAVLRHSV